MFELATKKNRRVLKVRTSEGGQDVNLSKFAKGRHPIYQQSGKENKNSYAKNANRFSQIGSNNLKYPSYIPENKNILHLATKLTNFTQAKDDKLLTQSCNLTKPIIDRVLFYGGEGANNFRSLVPNTSGNRYKHARTITSRNLNRISEPYETRLNNNVSDRGYNYNNFITQVKKRSERTPQLYPKMRDGRPGELKNQTCLRYQVSTIKGSKEVNQDSVKAGEGVWIVCDGHGQNGHEVSWHASSMLFELYQQMTKKQKFQSSMFDYMFRETERSLEQSGIDISLSGSTCVMVVKTEDTILCACLGDSVAVAFKQDLSHEIISFQHKPGNPSQTQRIEFFGGAVRKTLGKEHLPGSPIRLWGQGSDDWGPGLAISRSFGDKMAQKYGLIFQPEIREIPFSKSLKHIVLGSDGLFDQVGPTEISTVLSASSPKTKKGDASKTLTQLAQSRWQGYCDDISAIVIYF